MAQYAAAVDQGTTSTRFMVFDHGGQVVSIDQKEHEQIYPKPGWVEHDPMEIWQRTQEVIQAGLDKVEASDIAGVGVTNQRETTIVWERSTGKPVYNAIVWQDTGGPDGGVHITDVTNASRTMMMNLETLDWDEEILGILGVPREMLPQIRASSEVYGEAKNGLAGIPVAGDLGDQQAALFGQTCFSVGEAKNTYGTGNFLLLNTGNEPVQSKSGLLTGLGYKIGDQPAVYMLEGSIAITGALVQWLRDNIGLISQSPEIEELAKSVEDNGGCYIVPAFSGLFAPYWKSNARGVVAGPTPPGNPRHIPPATP